MLDRFCQVTRDLPSLIHRNEMWSSLDINYHSPRVLRLWTEVSGARLDLHEILNCRPEEALKHPHDWASAILVAKGVQQVGIGYQTTEDEPEIDEWVTLNEGDLYWMDDPNQWHAVAPETDLTLSVMLTEKPWGLPQPPRSKQKLYPLPPELFNVQIDKFRELIKGGILNRLNSRDIFKRYRGQQGYYRLGQDGQVINP